MTALVGGTSLPPHSAFHRGRYILRRWGKPSRGQLEARCVSRPLGMSEAPNHVHTHPLLKSLEVHPGFWRPWVSFPPQPASHGEAPSGRCPHIQHSLFFDFICCGPSDLLRVGLGFASVPQVNEGFIYVEDNHGSPGPQATTVTGHFQQIPFHRHFSAHTVQPPLACRGQQRHRVRMCAARGRQHHPPWAHPGPSCDLGVGVGGSGGVAASSLPAQKAHPFGVRSRFMK